MAKARAVLVGVKNMKDGSWNRGTENAEHNVDQIEKILSGFERLQKLKTEQAKKDRVLQAIKDASAGMSAEDLFVFYYAGHGLQGQLGQPRHLIVLYDQMLDTAALGDIWPSFPAGARIVMISESCNSGTDYARYLASLGLLQDVEPHLLELIMADKNPDLFNLLELKNPGIITAFGDDGQAAGMKAQMLHFGATADAEPALGGEFTLELVKVWEAGGFNNYRQFFCAILKAVNAKYPNVQFPEYRPYGPTDKGFENQKPFAIDPPRLVLNMAVNAITSKNDC